MSYPDYFATYDRLWRPIVENPDGSLDRDQIMRELHDYAHLMRAASQVYCEVTGGLLSKTTYDAATVISEFEDYVNRLVEQGVTEWIEDYSESVLPELRSP